MGGVGSLVPMSSEDDNETHERCLVPLFNVFYTKEENTELTYILGHIGKDVPERT